MGGQSVSGPDERGLTEKCDRQTSGRYQERLRTCVTASADPQCGPQGSLGRKAMVVNSNT
jgi:hypothetical protein